MKNGIFIAIVVFLVGAFAFLVGTRLAGKFVTGSFYGRQIAPRQGFLPHGRGMTMNGKDGGFFRGAAHESITKIEGNSLTVQLPGGGSYTVTLGDQTAVNKLTKGVKEDLKVGQNISLFGGGPWNNAQTIIINP